MFVDLVFLFSTNNYKVPALSVPLLCDCDCLIVRTLTYTFKRDYAPIKASISHIIITKSA